MELNHTELSARLRHLWEQSCDDCRKDLLLLIGSLLGKAVFYGQDRVVVLDAAAKSMTSVLIDDFGMTEDEAIKTISELLLPDLGLDVPNGVMSA